ncbi:acyl-CoA dehydrogenase family protein [Williamsia deligens]|uniref:Acyl-CoA dehydrogenase family protein n=1 Tax=Williamsia deligens TaxID=321325 RepID=A0ABW3G4A0_9NOCA|nr:acyl-CoA dehydrogenase family protein [Williamsia deligens]
MADVSAVQKRDAVTRARQAVAGVSLPAPGSGRTQERLDALAALARDDIPVGRLVEAHVDATQILQDLDGAAPGPDELWGVWAAEASGVRLRARRSGGRWHLSGVKPWCSGAVGCTHALVTAWEGDGEAGPTRAMFAVDLRRSGVAVVDDRDWHAAGMAATRTHAVRFDDVVARRVASGSDYLDRPGFWHGAIGVAACWFGGAQRVADRVHRGHRDDALSRSHLGAVDTAIWTGRAVLREAAAVVDRHPHDLAVARVTALRTRAAVEAVADTVLDRAGRALGPGPMVGDAAHAAAVADLTVYIRQSHADHDLAALGDLVATAALGDLVATSDGLKDEVVAP